ncbi:T9SS type A sorting domain-containing protein [Winogradskyella echinorum]|uniref:T9SS type A sorting domain-containing protein n=1 Tax=Winogradskyella echinorum TaxID=538189 RepID=A0ABR6Y420_9FLAO|nr:T9SS type A sorting domain-containing protein [Winogradskyella echinorum]MBC5751825.1 T9SS type A sorting domain-containing protein [Winogradskyella echinorum]
MSALAGQAAVYIAFRHHNVTDEFVLNIDNIAVSAILGVNDFDLNTFTYYYNKDIEVLNLESSNVAMTSIEIYSILGQSVISRSLENATESIDISSLNNGVYLAKVNIDGNFKTIKFVKN